MLLRRQTKLGRQLSPILAMRRTCLVLGMAIAIATISSVAVAQSPSPEGQNAAITGPEDITWQLLVDAPFASSYRITQQRTFADGLGGMVTLRESLEVYGDGTPYSPFRLDFEAVVGQPPVAPTSSWGDAYVSHAGLIHRHGAFAVRDLANACRNYRLLDFGDVRRAGHDARRVIVFPRRLDKGIWVVDLDLQTGVPLYRAEYNVHGKLLSELEVSSFLPIATPASPPNGWRARLYVSSLSNFSEAASRLSAQPVEPDIGSIMGEYVQHMMHVSEDPVNGDKSLVLGYTDGVDEFFIVQEFDRIDPLPIPRAALDATGAHTIASYDDPSMRVFVFHLQGVTYKVAGRASLTRLQDVALHFCRQIVRGR